jgi:hypothetical protein
MERANKIARMGPPEHLRFYLLGRLSLSIAAFRLFHFICIWVYGQFYIAETKIWLLTLETVSSRAYCTSAPIAS